MSLESLTKHVESNIRNVGWSLLCLVTAKMSLAEYSSEEVHRHLHGMNGNELLGLSGNLAGMREELSDLP